MIKIVKGNILASPEDHIIIQQVNCMGVMGKGIALSIANMYPYVKKQYLAYCNGQLYRITNEKPAPRDLLGNVFMARDETISDRMIACIFGQLNYHRYWEAPDVRHTDYGALENGFSTLATFYKGCDLHFAIPYKIGCVNAGGDWSIVYDMIERTIGNDFEVTMYQFDKYQ